MWNSREKKQISNEFATVSKSFESRIDTLRCAACMHDCCKFAAVVGLSVLECCHHRRAVHIQLIFILLLFYPFFYGTNVPDEIVQKKKTTNKINIVSLEWKEKQRTRASGRDAESSL